MPEKYLTVDEMAERFAISRSTAWRWIRERELLTYRFVGDRKTYLRAADLESLKEPIPITEPKKAAA